jgi:response regulator of citrate/malate metabolism
MKKINVLIIDDDMMIASGIASLIANILSVKGGSTYIKSTDFMDFSHSLVISPGEELSFEVSCDSISANHILEKRDFSAIILDGNLLYGDHGREVLEVMNEQQKSITIVISGDKKFLEEVKSQGVLGLSKNFDAKKFKEAFIKIIKTRS